MNHSINLIKSVAILLVVMNHVSSWFQVYNSNLRLYVVYQSIAAIGVPLFFCASGYLLLSKDEPIHEFFKKRASKILIPFVCWSYIYLIYQKFVPLLTWQRIFPAESVSFNPIALLQGPTYGHLWFMYVIISLYIAMPIFRNLCRNISSSVLNYLLILWVIGSIQVFVSQVWGLRIFVISFSFLSLFMCSGLLFLGFKFAKEPFIGKRLLLFCWLSGIVLTIIALSIWRVKHQDLPFNNIFVGTEAPFVILAVFGAFGYLLSLPVNSFDSRLLKLLNSISDASLGIFLCHFIPLYLLSVKPLSLFNRMNPVWGVMVVSILCLSISYAFVLIGKKIPLVRRIF